MPNPSDDDLSIPALLSETASAVLTTQRVLNHEIRPTLPEAETGTRFWMTSIPRIEVSWKISLITRKDKKLFFIPQGHKTDRLLHVISLLFSAVPAAPEPLSQSVPLESEPLPLILLEPPFLVNERESNRVCETLVAALREGRWRGQVRKKIDQKKVNKAAAQISEALESPDDSHPERGLIVFRLTANPSLWLIVNVTKDESNDGVFLLPGTDSPTVDIFNMAGDDNEKMLYFPLHLLVMAVRRWLAGEQPLATALTGGLPSRWGISSLDGLARGLLQGYLACNELLAKQQTDETFPVCYDIADVRAEIAFSISQHDDDTQLNLVAPRTKDSEELISGRVLIRVERELGRARLNVALVAPGIILVGDSRSAFIKQARAAAGEIAALFTLDPSHMANYRQWIQSPANAEKVVIFASAKNKDDPFGYLVIWPGIWNGEERDFIFSCKQKGESLEDFDPVVSVDDDVRSTLIDTPENDGGFGEDQYSHFSRFFRAARIWSAGFGAEE